MFQDFKNFRNKNKYSLREKGSYLYYIPWIAQILWIKPDDNFRGKRNPIKLHKSVCVVYHPWISCIPVRTWQWIDGFVFQLKTLVAATNACTIKSYGKEDWHSFIGPQEFVVGYSKAPEQPQSSVKSTCHSHAMMSTGAWTSHRTHYCIGACRATHCATGDV